MICFKSLSLSETYQAVHPWFFMMSNAKMQSCNVYYCFLVSYPPCSLFPGNMNYEFTIICVEMRGVRTEMGSRCVMISRALL